MFCLFLLQQADIAAKKALAQKASGEMSTSAPADSKPRSASVSANQAKSKQADGKYNIFCYFLVDWNKLPY